jgi:predicted PhzF superfamily epimerase YddE/YHI9
MKSFDIRWFTPTTEIDLCGHATLAAAHALYETNRVGPAATIAFHTKEKGILYVQQKVDRDSHLLHMDFPADVPVPCTLSEGKVLIFVYDIYSYR